MAHTRHPSLGNDEHRVALPVPQDVQRLAGTGGRRGEAVEAEIASSGIVRMGDVLGLVLFCQGDAAVGHPHGGLGAQHPAPETVLLCNHCPYPRPTPRPQPPADVEFNERANTREHCKKEV